MLDFGILWINSRNLNYIKKFNPRKSIKLADNKFKTKQFLSERWIPVPSTYWLITSRKQLQNFDFENLPKQEYVIKPNKWSKWNWIFITKNLWKTYPDIDMENSNRIYQNLEKIGQNNKFIKYLTTNINKNEIEKELNYYKVSWKTISENTLERYLLDILWGKYSMTLGWDTILIEEKLVPWEWFERFCKHWLADIRVIVFNLVPIASMVRIPTEKSEWKANLAQWWAAAWIEVWSWKIYSYYTNRKIHLNQFPKDKSNLKWYQMPFWDEILFFSSQIQFYVNLWYLALDWVITPEWPKLLEINARAWLELQNVCSLNLKTRLDKVDWLKVSEPEKGVEIAKSLFSSNKLLIWLDKVLYLNQMCKLNLWTKPNITSKEFVLEVDLSKEKNYIHANHYEKYEIARKNSSAFISPKGTSIILKNITLSPSEKVPIDKIIIWKNVASEYYVKPINIINIWNSIINQEMIDINEYSKIVEIDTNISRLSWKLNLSKILKPTNYFEEFDNFITWRKNYNPRFTYNFPEDKSIIINEDNINIIKDWLTNLKSPIKILFDEKILELKYKLELINAYKAQDFESIEKYNLLLYWDFDDELVTIAKEKNFNNYDNLNQREKINVAKVKALFEEHLKKIWINWVKVTIGNTWISRITVLLKNNPEIQLSSNTNFYKNEIQWIIAHEIDTHLVRFVKWKESWWNIFEKWTGFYLKDEEWLAIYNSINKYNSTYEPLWMYKKYHLLKIWNNYNFAKIYDLISFFNPNNSIESNFKGCLRIKKGIINTYQTWIWTSYLKDKIYLDWYYKIKTRVDNWWDIEKLYNWKYKIDDLKYLNI